jgi:glycosyltransferase involved in cell wall biosynthesis
LPAAAAVLLYAGNLDGYQGWEQCLHAVARLQHDFPEVVLLVGTESDPRALRAAAQRAGIAQRIRVAPLAGEAARHTLHAAADVALVTRRTPGGLPIKLLDALARGLCCVVTPTATGGLALGRAAEPCAADDGPAIAATLAAVLTNPAGRHALGDAARGYVAREHDPARFCEALDEVCSLALLGRLGPSAAPSARIRADRDSPLQTQVF